MQNYSKIVRRSRMNKLNQLRIQQKYKINLKNNKNNFAQGISKLKLEKATLNLERLKNKLNSTPFFSQIQNENQTQTDETIESLEKVNLAKIDLQKEIKQYQDKESKLLEQIQTLQKEINSLKQKEGLFSLLSISYQPQFNANYKLSKYNVANPKLIQAPQGGFGIATMQPPLPKDKLTTFAFKINKYNSWVGVGIGICHLQTAYGFNYDMNGNYTSTNHNTYLACAGGYRISSYEGYNGVTNFIYNQGSIIICYYDPTNFKLNLLHLNDGKTYLLDLTNNNGLEMSPCVMLYGNAEVEFI